MSAPLDPSGRPVRVGRVTLRTPGLAGVAESLPPESEAVRGRRTGPFDAALQRADITAQETIEIERAREVEGSAAETRATSAGEPGIELDVAAPSEGWGQAVLYTDEAGIVRWIFAADGEGAAAVTRGEGVRRYVVPRRVPPRGDGGARGLIGSVGTKLLQVLVFPLLGPVLGAVGNRFAAEWEKRECPYGIRSFTPDDYRQPKGMPVTAERWTELSTGPTLLFVHGTFGRAYSAFDTLPTADMAELHRRYGGRVIAFDHPTASEDPRANGKWFFEHVPDGARLELDIVCHSRGGLPSRVLAERQADFPMGSRRIRVRKVIFAASPNAGCVLADMQHMSDFVDSYTNLLNFFPNVGAVAVIDGLIALAKQLAIGAFGGLGGLNCMSPDSKFLREWLNTGERAGQRYYALSADFEPTGSSDGGLKVWVKDHLMDRIFRTENDLVVPTAGVYDANGSGLFPIADRVVYGPNDGLHHGSFFADPRSRRQMLQWLS